MKGLDVSRLAKVLVTTSEATYRYGTAYAVTPDLLLTARHVVHGAPGKPPAIKVEVRFLQDEEPPREVKLSECWASSPELDACLLKLPEARPSSSPLQWGEYKRSRRVDCESTGFPSAAMEKEEGRSRLDTADVYGYLGQYGAIERKQFAFTITAGGPSSAEDWQGLSGAPVFAEKCLVGLIRSAPDRFGGRQLYVTPVARLLEVAAFRQAVGAPKLQPVPRPYLHDNVAEPPGAKNPGALLNVRYRVVPFHKQIRQKEFKSLTAWCEEREQLAIRLFTGAGGMGKTRLFIQWCEELRDQGWQAGFLPPIEHGDRGEYLERLKELLEGNDPIFLAIDDAEVRTSLRDELKCLKENMSGAPRVRVALLARQEGDWWQGLREQEELGDLLEWHAPLPLTPVSMEGLLREEVFKLAQRAFADKLGKEITSTTTVPDLSAPLFERTLFLHMAALATVEGLDFRANSLVDEILKHEQRFWCAPEQSGNDLRERSYLRGARRAVAALTLTGGVAEPEEAETTLAAARAPDDAFLEVLRRLYPGSGREGDAHAYLRGLEPDVLGERLVEQVLLEPETGKAYLKRIFEDAGEAAVRNGFLVLGSLSLQREREPRLWLKQLLEPDVRGRAKAAFQAAMALGKKSAFGQVGVVLAEGVRQQGSVELAKELEALIPDHTVSLREVALWVNETLLKHLRAGSDDLQAERARLLNNLGMRLSDLGRREEALAATQAAVEIRRELAGSRPEAFLPKLAMSLNNLGNSLSELGRREEALEATQEAVEIRRKLAGPSPEAFLPELAGNLNNLGLRLSHLGRREDALAATQEAVDHYRELAGPSPEAFLPYLAASLDNLGNRLSELGRREEALEATQAAVEICRQLAGQRPEAFLPELAMSLNNLGNSLSELGRREEALAATQAAVENYRKLAGQRPEAFLPDLAGNLDNLGNRLSELGRREEALVATQEAAVICRKLAGECPEAFLPYLAGNLSNLGNRLSELGRSEEALEATQEAVEHYRKLAGERPEAFHPDLAASLNSLGNCLSELGQKEEALAATQEAVEICRKLAGARPEAFLPDLAGNLSNLGNRLSALGRSEEALAATQEAVEHYRKLAGPSPDAFLPDLAMSLSNLVNRLSELGRSEEALVATQESVEIRRQLAGRRPEAFLPDLAGNLNNLGLRLSELGRREEALDATQEAVEHYRELAGPSPKAFLPYLAMSLDNLGDRLSELGRREEALAATQEAMEHYRELAGQRPEAFLPDLAASLNNLGLGLSELGRREEALAATQEAVEHYRELTRQHPQAFLPSLAVSLNNLGNRLSELGRTEEALAALQEAVKHYLHLDRQHLYEGSFPAEASA